MFFFLLLFSSCLNLEEGQTQDSDQFISQPTSNPVFLQDKLMG